MRGARRAAIALLGLLAATAADAAPSRSIDIPAGALGPAVIALGRQAGISIGLSDPSLAALPVPRVRGRMSVRSALVRLLKNSGATFKQVGDDGWRIVRAPLPAPIVTALRPKPRPAPAAPPPQVAEPADIIVTASKRDTPLSSYPGSASVFRMDDLPIGAEGNGSGAVIARLSSVTSTHLGAGRNKLFIRGIADSSFNGPTQATVGQYLGETRLNYNAPDPDLRLYDISQVEILQGPQGTLHGAGSLGGVLRIMPRAPRLDRIEGSAALSAAATAHGDPSVEASGVFNLPLVEDRLGLRAVVYGLREGGYIDDTLRNRKDVNRVDTLGGRLSFRLDPGNGWTVDLGGTFQTINARDGQYADRGAPRLTRASAVEQSSDNDYGLGQVTIRKAWDSLRFTSATGIVRQDIAEVYDATVPNGVPTLFRQRSRISLLTNENRLSRTLEDGSSWIVGTSFVRNRYRLNRAQGPVGMAPSIAGVANGIDEITLFGELTKHVTDRFSVTGGGRLTHARLSGTALDPPTFSIARAATLQARRTETTFLPSLAASYEIGDNAIFYARYQEGFRPGGIVVRDNLIQRYRNDDVAMIEGGVRFGGPLSPFDGRISVAHTRWRNIQADLIDSTGLPATSNIGTGRIWSVDAALGWRPVPGLRIEAAGVYADSRLTRPISTLLIFRTGIPSGNFTPPPGTIVIDRDDLPNVAPFNGRFGFDYFTALPSGIQVGVSGWARYVGSSRLGIGPVLGVSQGDYIDTSLGVRLAKERYGVFMNATNLFDSLGNRFALGSPFTLPYRAQVTPLRPRTIRVGIDMRF